MVLEYISYTGKLLLVINIITYGTSFAGKKRVEKVFTCYLAYILLVEAGFHLLRNMKINNLFLSHFYFIGQNILLSYFYYLAISSRKLRQILLTTVLIATSASLVNIMFGPATLGSFNYFEIFACNFSVIIAALLYQYDTIEKKNTYYYGTTGLLLYLISTTIIFLSGNLLIGLKLPEYTKYVWLLNASLFVMLQLFFLHNGISLLKHRRIMISKKIING